MTMKKPTKFIYFDVGGVLLDWRAGHQKVAAKYNVPYESIRDVFEANWQNACRGILAGDEYMGMFARVLGITGTLPEVADFWTDHFTVISETHSLVAELSRTYRIGILSNAEKGSMKYAFQKGLIPKASWEVTIDSSQYGVIKPETRIYEIAEAAVNVTPEELFFIDDVPTHITTAESRGWKGMVFDTGDVKGSVEKIREHLGLPAKK